MYNQYIYEDFDDYDILEDDLDETAFATNVVLRLNTENFLDFITDQTSGVQLIKTLCYSLCVNIFMEYGSSRVAYKSNQWETFYQRIANTLVYKINKWIIERKFSIDFLKHINTEFVGLKSSGETSSMVTEDGTSGSAVMQESASTPTGIEHTDGDEDMSMALDGDGTTFNLETTDGYEDKYTNFMGKTKGIHRNNVNRDTTISRTGNHELALDILKKIPYSYISEVLAEVSQHFIQVY